MLNIWCLCLSGISENCTPCRARMSLTADNCFALLHSPLHLGLWWCFHFGRKISLRKYFLKVYEHFQIAKWYLQILFMMPIIGLQCYNDLPHFLGKKDGRTTAFGRIYAWLENYNPLYHLYFVWIDFSILLRKRNGAWHCLGIPVICHRHHRQCLWRFFWSCGEISSHNRLSCGEILHVINFHVEKALHLRNVKKICNVEKWCVQFMVFCCIKLL